MESCNAGGVFENTAALFWFGVDDLADLTLAYQRGRARTCRGILKQDFDVARARFSSVDAVSGASLALDAPRDFDDVRIVVLGGCFALGVIQKDRDFRAVSRWPVAGT